MIMQVHVVRAAAQVPFLCPFAISLPQQRVSCEIGLRTLQFCCTTRASETVSRIFDKMIQL